MRIASFSIAAIIESNPVVRGSSRSTSDWRAMPDGCVCTSANIRSPRARARECAPSMSDSGTENRDPLALQFWHSNDSAARARPSCTVPMSRRHTSVRDRRPWPTARWRSRQTAGDSATDVTGCGSVGITASNHRCSSSNCPAPRLGRSRGCPGSSGGPACSFPDHAPSEKSSSLDATLSNSTPGRHKCANSRVD